jgi:hypothetical protein
MILSAAFFAPLIGIVPFSSTPPLIFILSICAVFSCVTGCSSGFNKTGNLYSIVL